MENAVQALKTGAAVLIFIIAITTTFVMFSKAKTTADAVISAQDKQKYLESPDVSGGILYTSKEDIEGEKIPTMTKEGYRIVDFDDLVSTLYRYSIEKYGVTIIKNNGDIIARFDSNTESIIIPNWTRNTNKQQIIDQLKKNITVKLNNTQIVPILTIESFEDFYKYTDINHNVGYAAEWFHDTEIIRHINEEIQSETYTVNGHTYSTANLQQYKNNNFIEILNTVDTSKYLEDKNENDETVKTSLQTQYQMPTIEIIYIIQE